MAAGEKSFYKRSLPDELIKFSSPEGKALFQSALLSGHMEGYFPLAEQFLTQNRPDHCAKSTLVMALNTLQIDPGRVWIKPWRWFSEDQLACLTEKSGLSIHEFAMVGLCNGAWQQAFYPKAQKERDQQPVVPRCCEESPKEETTCCRSHAEEGTSECSGCFSATLVDCCNPNSHQLHLKYASLQTFRAAIKASMRREGFIVLLNHSRKALHQTGDGHYSPIAGYDEESDMALVMDVARFKYPAYWCPAEKLYASLEFFDAESEKMRGFLLVGKPKLGEFEAQMTIDRLSIARIQSKLRFPDILADPPMDIYPILIYHFVTLSEALISDEHYAQFKAEAEHHPSFSVTIPVSEECDTFLEELAEELKLHYIAVIQAAFVEETQEAPLFGLFVRTLQVQLGLK